jgi:branched-subunit amino acid transport protein AzlD
MLSEILAPVLTIVIGFLLRKALKSLKVDIDEKTFNTLVAAIVVYLLVLVGVDTARALAPAYFQ